MSSPAVKRYDKWVGGYIILSIVLIVVIGLIGTHLEYKRGELPPKRYQR